MYNEIKAVCKQSTSTHKVVINFTTNQKCALCKPKPRSKISTMTSTVNKLLNSEKYKMK